MPLDPAKNPWTETIAAKLRDLWPHGWSCSALADKLNIEFDTQFSRNAIIGKAHRLGLEPRTEVLINRVGKPMRPRRPRKSTSTWKTPSPLVMELYQTPIVNFVPLNTPFVDLEPDQCREVMPGKGDDGLAIYCGHPKLESCSYCAAHAKINYHIPQHLSEAERDRRRQQARNNNARSFAG